jgi:hypothetical protein
MQRGEQLPAGKRTGFGIFKKKEKLLKDWIPDKT